uniref:G-protein coupled receptors family 1 profile domain-containing protein n=1 Tax=Plectus sambesii TaxID=2011161 RepID=A0A914VIY6_9BILA
MSAVNLTNSALQSLVDASGIKAMQGGVLFGLNLIIIVVIFFHRLLRQQKEYVIVVGRALCDALRGFAMIVTGLGRIFMVKYGSGYVYVSRWECYLKPWNILFDFSDPLGAYVLVMVSLDRLFAVSVPLRYFSLTTDYAWKMNGALFLFVIGNVAVGAVLSYTMPDSHVPLFPSYCYYSQHSDHPAYQQYIVLCRIIPPTISVILYGFVLHYSRMTGISEQQQAQKMKKLGQITITLGIACFVTLTVHVIPVLYQYAFVPYLGAPAWVTMYSDVYLLNNMEPLMNIFIYLGRQKDLRAAFMALLRCKQLKPGSQSVVQPIGSGPHRHMQQKNVTIVKTIK